MALVDEKTDHRPAAVEWPTSINLAERIPQGQERGGELRYACTHNGTGRMDMMRFKDVPQHLVDAALDALAEAA